MSNKDVFVDKLLGDRWIKYSKKDFEELKTELKTLYHSLDLAHYSIISSVKTEEFLLIPKDIEIIETYEKLLDIDSLAKDNKKINLAIKELKIFFEYLLNNQNIIYNYPSRQLNLIKIALRWIKNKLYIISKSDLFDDKEIKICNKLLDLDSNLYQSISFIEKTLEFDDNLSINKAIDLMSTLDSRLDMLRLIEDSNEFIIFLYDIRNIREYVVENKNKLERISETQLEEIKNWFQKIKNLLEKEIKDNKLTYQQKYNLKKLISKDIKEVITTIVEIIS